MIKQKLIYFICLGSLLFGACGAYLIKIYGQKLGYVDYPNDRSSHRLPTPKGGGIGILLAFIGSSLILDIDETIWVPISIIAIISFYGDRVDIPAKVRLILQFICAEIILFPVFLENLEKSLMIVQSIELISISIFIVGTANFYNFMDGIDGISATTGIVGFALLALNGIIIGEEQKIIYLSISMCFACLGFLPLNIFRDRIFMGDVGSILLGFLFAVIVYKTSKNIIDYICLSSFLFPYYADELTTMAIRIKNKENFMQAHRKHLYQIAANELKIPHVKVSLAYGIIQCLIGSSTIVAMMYNKLFAIAMILIYCIIFASVNYYIRFKIKNQDFFSKFS